MPSRLERRCIGLDVPRAFAQGLGPADEVALEVTGNTGAIATVLASRAGRVVVSNPAKTRAMALLH